MCFQVHFVGLFPFNSFHIAFIRLTRPFQNMFDLGNRDYREEFREQEVAGKEQTERTEIKTDFPDSRSVVSTPAAWQVIAVK